MSNIQYAFIERARVPDRSALQASIDALGVPLELHPDYKPFEDSGFLPFVLQGQEAQGFDVQYLQTADVLEANDLLRPITAGLDCCISMGWHGSMRDLACVLIVSYALAKDFGAVVSYEGEPPEPLPSLLAAIHETLADAAREREESADRRASAIAPPVKKPWWKLW